eukprot:2065186-Rhodomonas_salina.2
MSGTEIEGMRVPGSREAGHVSVLFRGPDRLYGARVGSYGAATRCPVLSTGKCREQAQVARTLRGGGAQTVPQVRGRVTSPPHCHCSVLRICYAVSGTDIRHAVRRRYSISEICRYASILRSRVTLSAGCGHARASYGHATAILAALFVFF